MLERERELACTIIGMFNDLLDKYDIDIPDDSDDYDDNQPEDRAHIYGENYYDLEDAITEAIQDYEKRI